jgi:hypothetical protein
LPKIEKEIGEAKSDRKRVRLYRRYAHALESQSRNDEAKMALKKVVLKFLTS